MRKGFSLIEFLAVLIIIIILAAMTNAYSKRTRVEAEVRARDGRRESDLVLIQGVIRKCWQENNYNYPLNYPSDLIGYFKPIPIPKDPKTGSDYTYVVDAKREHYALQADLEDGKREITNGVTPGPGGGSGVYDVGGNKVYQVVD